VNRATLALLVAGGLALAPGTDAKVERSREVTAKFQHERPCPSTGKRWGACPGWVKDHVDPLCNGGPDLPSNMQGQTIADGKAKDGRELKGCRAHR
jgi:hypothetical protein